MEYNATPPIDCISIWIIKESSMLQRLSQEAADSL